MNYKLGGRRFQKNLLVKIFDKIQNKFKLIDKINAF